MPRRAAAAGAGPALFPVDDATTPSVPAPIPVGRNERALLRSVRDAQHLTPAQYRSATTTARSLARALDIAEHRANPYAIAQTAPQLAELLGKLGLLPDLGAIGGGEHGDPFAGAGVPEVGD